MPRIIAKIERNSPKTSEIWLSLMVPYVKRIFVTATITIAIIITYMQYQ